MESFQNVEGLIEEIKDVPLSQVLANFIRVQVKYGRIVGLCPFHPDTHPSLSISDAKGLFHCFACGAEGDVISFAQKFFKANFIESLKILAETLHLSLEKYEKKSLVSPKILLARKILESLQEIFVSDLKNPHSQEYKAFQDFLQYRKLSWEVAKKFELGIVLGGTKFLLELSSKEEKVRQEWTTMALEQGILKLGASSQELKESFRYRVMFPLRDISGHLVGFTGRGLQQTTLPKYLNSKESFIFKKQTLLYGYHLAKSAIREHKKVLICEGNMDVIAFHQANIPYSVALMGTGISPSLSLLKKNVSSIFLVPDTDEAGQKAAHRLSSFFWEQEIFPKIISLSPHKDPDEFFHHHSKQDFLEKEQAAQDAMEFFLEKLLPKEEECQHWPVDKKLTVLEEVFTLLAPAKNHFFALELLGKARASLQIQSSQAQIEHLYADFWQKNSKKEQKTEAFKREEANSKEKDQTKIKRETKEATQEIKEKKSEEITQSHRKEIFYCLEIVCQIPDLLQGWDEMVLKLGIKGEEVRRYFAKASENFSPFPSWDLFYTYLRTILDAGVFSKGFRDCVYSFFTHYRSQDPFVQSPLLQNKERKNIQKREQLIEHVAIKIHILWLVEKKERLKQQRVKCETDDDFKILLEEMMALDRKINTLQKQQRVSVN